jgi:hypothetical protein
MLKHRPAGVAVMKYVSRNHFIVFMTLACIGLRFVLGVDLAPAIQTALGVFAWIVLIGLLLNETNAVRFQVALAVFCATVGQSFVPAVIDGGSSGFAAVSAFDPPHYGLIYLALVSLWRSASLRRFRWGLAALVLLLSTTWSIWDVNYAGEASIVGVSLFFAFLLVESFFIMSCLEMVVSWLGARRALVFSSLSVWMRQFFRVCPRDLVVASVTFLSVALCLYLDADATLERQYALGICAWTLLIALLLGETPAVRVQVVIAIIFATIGEHFASPFMGGYIYRFENVPAYVPPGHGMVYLTAVALARSGFFQRYRKHITVFVLTVGSTWSLWGVTLAERGDAVGALLFCVFFVFVFLGRSPLVYLAAFFITTWLEVIGTYYGTWRWVVIDPVLGLPQGNPPSGVAAWYCLVDAVALGGAPHLLRAIESIGAWLRAAYSKKLVLENVAADE